MKSLEIVGYKRVNLGKKDAKTLRGSGNVPCVLYGGDAQAHFHVPMILFRKLVYTPEIYEVQLNIEGDTYRCILQDIQFHPVSEIIMHADFLQITDNKPIKIKIPIKPQGDSPGVMKGGKLILKQKKIQVKALPKNIPDHINLDISNLDLGKRVKVSDLKSESYEILTNLNIPVASVEVPRVLRDKEEDEGKEESE